MNRRESLVLLAGCSVLSAPVVIAQVRDINDAINMAGRQRMLSQRMVKGYLALGQTVMVEFAEKVLGASLALFDRQLADLRAFAPTPEIKSTYAQLTSAWGEYKGALVGASPSKPGAEQVVRLSGKVLALAHQGTVELEGVSGRPAGRFVNIAGRQRMLSQRMAACYFSASWGVQGEAAVVELNKAKDEFVKAHGLLKTTSVATDAIRAELELAATQFSFFDAALRNLRPGNADAVSLGNVFTTSERILQVMDNVTGLFAKIA